jgi:hypothetical protein
MNNMIPVLEQAPDAPPDDAALLAKRLQTVETVSEMVSTNAARLIERARQLEAALDRFAEQIGPLPEPSRVRRLTESMESLQALLDWLATRDTGIARGRSASAGQPADLSGIQARLSMHRLSLTDLQGQMQRASAVNASLRDLREGVARLASDLEALTDTRDRAETLLGETRRLTGDVDRSPEPLANLDEA